MESNPVAVPINQVPFESTDHDRHPFHCTCASESSIDKSLWINEYTSSPGGIHYWIPVVQDDLKPIVGTIFDSLDKGIEMYAKYARFGGFDFRRSTQKTARDGSLLLKFLVCTKAGKLSDDATQDTKERRRSTSQRTDCGACVRFKWVKGTSFSLYYFEEKHNHKLDIGSRVDYKKFNSDLSPYVGESDAWRLLQKLDKKKKDVPQFSFEYEFNAKRVFNRLFWADETSKRNYLAFGDVISFDATYSTNKYDMVFVSFTGINNHKERVTFAVGLIASESIDSYTWLFRVFLKTFGKGPHWVLTDQDPLIKQAVVDVFGRLEHRFCIRHIMDKLPSKVCSDVLDNTNFRQRLHDIVWTDFSEPIEFEKKWSLLIDEFKMQNNKWLLDMFEMRHKWITAYVKDMGPFCGLTKTMSMSESKNDFSQRYLHHDSTLNDLMTRFEFVMVSQRKTQQVLDNETCLTIPEFKTSQRIEVHAHKVYTKAVFMDVQIEIYEAVFSCLQTSESSENGGKICYIMDQKKPGNTLYKVLKNKDKISCSCMHFDQYGILCRHAFCVLRVNRIEEIPSRCIDKRWTRDALNIQPLDLSINPEKHTDGRNQSSADLSVKDIYTMFGDFISRVRNDVNKLVVFRDKFQEMTKEVLSGDVADKGCGKRRQCFVVDQNLSEEDTAESDLQPTRKCRFCGEVAFHDFRNCPVRKRALQVKF